MVQTLRDRLIALIYSSTCGALIDDEVFESDIDITQREIERIADHLLANGVMVLPFNVGQTVYIIENADMLYIDPSVCSIVKDIIFGISFAGTQSGVLSWFYSVVETGKFFHDTDIGKTVFRTKEEAEHLLNNIVL